MLICTLGMKWQKHKEKEKHLEERKSLQKWIKISVGCMCPIRMQRRSAWPGICWCPRQVSLGQTCWPSQTLSSAASSFLGPFETFRQGLLPRKTPILTCTSILHRVLRGQESVHAVQLNIHNTVFSLLLERVFSYYVKKSVLLWVSVIWNLIEIYILKKSQHFRR